MPTQVREGPDTIPEVRRTTPGRVLAWCAHGYTALGLVLAAWMAVSILEGDAAGFHRAFVLMLVATLVDATDGALARAARVKQVLPGFDGRRLDDLIDFLTYVSLPLFLVYRAGVLPPGWEPLLLAPLVASAYGFCQVEAKTDDGYFLGFPSLWNVVAFYLYVLHAHVEPLPGWLSAGVVLVLSLLTFVPTRYLYASLPGTLNRVTAVLGAAWAALLVWILWRMRDASPGDPAFTRMVLLSLAFPAYYLGASWVVTWKRWHEGGTGVEGTPEV